MRQAFAHEAILVMDPEADAGAPGACITVALCGHWDHDPPCPLSPHHVHAEQAGDELRVRILFAADAGTEGEVRRRIELALAGRWQFPDGLTPRWDLRRSRSSEVTPDERGHAERLIVS
jgi:hypothetical protein